MNTDGNRRRHIDRVNRLELAHRFHEIGAVKDVGSDGVNLQIVGVMNGDEAGPRFYIDARA